MSKITERHQKRLDALLDAQTTLEARFAAKEAELNAGIEVFKARIVEAGACIASLASDKAHEANVLVDKIDLMKELLAEDVAADALDASTPTPMPPADVAAVAVVVQNIEAASVTAVEAAKEAVEVAKEAVADTQPGGDFHAETISETVPATVEVTPAA
jgi:hypothetical protein